MFETYKLSLHGKANPESVIQGKSYRFTVLTSRLIRLEYQEEGRFVDDATQTVICRDFPKVDFRVMETEASLEIVTEHLHLYYDKQPFSREGLTIELKGGFFVYGSAWSYGDEVRTLKGTTRTLDNINGAAKLDEGLMSRAGFTLLDDSRSCLIGDDQWPKAKEWESVDLYFLGYGHDYLGCLKDFYRLSGATPLLPRFALGNWWSRYYKYTEESYLKLMEEFRSRKIPLSTAVIDMDWHLVDIPEKYGSGWTGYTWNRAFFPDPERFLGKLHDFGMKTTLNVHPADGVRAHEEAYLEMAKAMGVDYENEDKIPFNAASREYWENYFKYLHHPLEKQGVDFWWLDWQQGTRGTARGIDTLFQLNHLHFLDSGRDGKAPLTFSRYAGLGSHRYPVGFSGDSHSTWESLDFQPYFTANASNVGYSWWSHDIGGHMLGRRDDELALRWLQFGVFSPIMRLHSSCNEFYGKEPWNYNLETQQTMTAFLQLRHRMIPYLHAMNHLTHQEGLPLMQPMYYHEDCPQVYNVPNEYWFGTEMIVCPITKPVDADSLTASFEAWIPEGEWYDFFTGQRYTGGRMLRLYRGKKTIPVLVKAGGIVPLADDWMTSHLENPRVLEIQVFQGADGRFCLYEDGEGGKTTVTRFTFISGSQPTLRIQHDDGIPAKRQYRILLRGAAAPAGQGDYDAAAKALTVTLTDDGTGDMTIPFSLTSGEGVGTDSTSRIYDLLMRAQIRYDVKETIYKSVLKISDKARLSGELIRMNPGAEILGAVLEQILSEV